MRWALAVLLLLIADPAAALKSTARWPCAGRPCCRRSARPRAIAAQRAARSLLAEIDAVSAPPAPAPAGPPLKTPEDALNVCSMDVLRKATKCKDRKHVFYEESGAEAEEECCKLMSSYYSDASTMKTRNCWCDADVWARNAELELKSDISLSGFFDACLAENYTAGARAIAYYQEGVGPCAGMPAAAAPAEDGEMEKPTKRSFGKWVREGLPDNPWVLFCFIVAIPSVIGFNIMMWPFIFHAILTVVEFPQKRAAKKAL